MAGILMRAWPEGATEASHRCSRLLLQPVCVGGCIGEAMGRDRSTQKSAARSEIREREAGGEGFRAEPRRVVFFSSNDAPDCCGSNGATPDPRSFLEPKWQRAAHPQSNHRSLNFPATSVIAGTTAMESMWLAYEEWWCIWQADVVSQKN